MVSVRRPPGELFPYDSSSVDKSHFIALFKNIARERHRVEVWSDFITLGAIALNFPLSKCPKRGQEYLTIMEKYDDNGKQQLCELFDMLTYLLEPEPADILGQLYMELEISSKGLGQYFTPGCVSELMAGIVHGEELENLDKPFITLQEPACGSGGMILAFVKVMISKGHNPADKLWVSAIDISRDAVLMTYIQGSLWGIPMEVIVGNTLTLELRESWLTPVHYLHKWDEKLELQRTFEAMMSLFREESPRKKKKVQPELPRASGKDTLGNQVEFDFRL